MLKLRRFPEIQNTTLLIQMIYIRAHVGKCPCKSFVTPLPPQKAPPIYYCYMLVSIYCQYTKHIHKCSQTTNTYFILEI